MSNDEIKDAIPLKFEDCFIVVRFDAPNSAVFTIQPNNVSPAQLFMVAEMLRWQAEYQMNQMAKAREGVQEQSKILVPKPGLH